MQKLLITGVSGFLGYHIALTARQRWQVFGTYFSQKINSDWATFTKLDLTDYPSLKEYLFTLKPDAVIHTAAQSKPNFCQNYPKESAQINVTASLDIAALCGELGIRCAFTSTDLVFNGLNAPYKETDERSPLSYYGEQKVQAEIGMLAYYPKTVIARMPLMFGNATLCASSFMQPFLQTLQQGKSLSLFYDEYRTPVSANAAAQGLLLALDKMEGVIHLGGKERMSRYQFGIKMAEVFGLDSSLVQSCSQADIPMAAPRPADVSLDSSQAFALGYQPLSIQEELKNLRYTT